MCYRGLAGTSAAGDQIGQSCRDDAEQELGTDVRDRAEPTQIFERQALTAERSQRQIWTVGRNRGQYRVQPSAVRQACVYARIAFVQTSATRRDESLREPPNLPGR